jgi:flagellar basal-body rod protein FlgC
MARAIDFSDVITIAAAGMRAQGDRLRVIAENVANANSTGNTPGAEPYRRREVLFKSVLDRVSGLTTVKVAGVRQDATPFSREYNPSHPAADKDGYVLMPNVKSLVEMIDMKEAQRNYDANISVLDAARNMVARALDILRG